MHRWSQPQAAGMQWSQPQTVGGGRGRGGGGNHRSCAACKRSLPKRSFSKNQSQRGQQARCQDCVKQKQKEWDARQAPAPAPTFSQQHTKQHTGFKPAAQFSGQKPFRFQTPGKQHWTAPVKSPKSFKFKTHAPAPTASWQQHAGFKQQQHTGFKTQQHTGFKQSGNPETEMAFGQPAVTPKTQTPFMFQKPFSQPHTGFKQHTGFKPAPTPTSGQTQKPAKSMWPVPQPIKPLATPLWARATTATTAVTNRWAPRPAAAVAPIQTQPPKPTGPAHNTHCDVCKESIIGVRYKCLCCPNFDTCEQCVAQCPIAPECCGGGCRHEIMVRVVDPKIAQDSALLQDQTEWTHGGAACVMCAREVRGRIYACTLCPGVTFCERCDLVGAHTSVGCSPTHPCVRAIIDVPWAPVVMASQVDVDAASGRDTKASPYAETHALGEFHIPKAQASYGGTAGGVEFPIGIS